jgi:dipeptidase
LAFKFNLYCYTEGWVMHFVPYPATNSAVWVAQRVPDDEVTVVMNMFTIRGEGCTSSPIA